MALPSPGILNTEISQMNSQKGEMLTAREGILGGIKELVVRKKDLEASLRDIYTQLENIHLPDEYKPQLLERVSMIKSTIVSIEQQQHSLQDRLQILERSVSGINNGIGIRKNVLDKLAGEVAKRKSTQTNREVGRIKG